MTPETLTRKEAIWLACKQKTCCYERLVTVTGRDVWRIARALDVDPWSFLIHYEAPAGPDTFILGHDQIHYRLALADGSGHGADPDEALHLSDAHALRSPALRFGYCAADCVPQLPGSTGARRPLHGERNTLHLSSMGIV